MSDDPGSPAADGSEERRRLTRRQRTALVFAPLVVVVAVLVSLLGVPWQVVAGALALFVLWLLIEG